jgi:hypothetical protein
MIWTICCAPNDPKLEMGEKWSLYCTITK